MRTSLDSSVSRAVTLEISERARWNDLVQSFPNYDLKQGFEWGDLRRESGWQPVRLAVLAGEDCLAACTILLRAVPVLGTLLYAPRGPLFHTSAPWALAPLLATVRKIARERRGILLRASPGVTPDDTVTLPCLGEHGFVSLPEREEATTWNTPRYTQTLDLRPSVGELWRGVRRRFRGYISAAPRRGCVIEASESQNDLEEFYALLVNAARLKGLPIRGLGYYQGLWRHYRRSNAITLLVARIGGRMAGGILWVRLGRRAWMLYASVRGSVADTLRHHVAPALYWEAIARAKVEGCEWADFGSSGVRIVPSESDPGWGVYHFKVGLGCRFETFAPYQDLVFRPLAYRLFRFSERRLAPFLWKGAVRYTSWRARHARTSDRKHVHAETPA